MKIGDLRKYLESHSVSPEQLAEYVSVSNMTIRRLLKLKDDEEIPPKYVANFSQLISTTGVLAFTGFVPEFLPADDDSQTGSKSDDGFQEVLENLKRSGSGVRDPEQVKSKLNKKLRDPHITGELLQKTKHVAKIAFDSSNSKMSRAVALGALLYLINPFDLIPDAYFPVGYLDDLAVLSLALGFIVKKGFTAAEAKKA